VQYHTALVECVLCHQMRPIHHKKIYQICSGCHTKHRGLVGAALSHHVDVATFVQWANDPRCALCRRTFYTGKNHGVGSGGLAVDHDHNCCQTGKSCGKCVRGLLCSTCNRSLGHAEAMIAKATLPVLLAYLGHMHDGRMVMQSYATPDTTPSDESRGDRHPIDGAAA
jgi:hypothetical protein